MAYFPDGSIVEGGTITAVDANPIIAGDGCVFIGVSFYNPSQFGEGCVFENCIFIDINNPYYNTQPHKTGKGNIFSGCTFNYVQFGEANVSDTPPIGGYRPNTVGQNMVFTQTQTQTPAQSSTCRCTQCGSIFITHSGEVIVDAQLVNCESQVAGGTNLIENTGVCCVCSKPPHLNI